MGDLYLNIMIWPVIATVALWWVANTIASIASKSVMKGDDVLIEGASEWTSAFQDLRWVDLTALQHVLGMAASVVWLKVVMGRSVWPTFVHSHRKSICIAALGNLVGNLATNAAYALLTSSTTQVVKACEPLFIVVLMALLYKNYEGLHHSTLMSVVIIVLGAVTFIRSDSTLNIWGLFAGMISNMAFSTRNIYLKNLSKMWDSPLQKFAVISIYSVLFLPPVLLIKLIVNWELSTSKVFESLISGVFHSTYNLASITVLQSVNPLTHAVLNISKRVFVIAANIVYFQIPISLNSLVGLLVLLVGCYLYQLNTSSKTKWILLKCILISCSLAYLFMPIGYSSQGKSYLPFRCLDKKITTAWVFERKIPNNVIMNIEAMAEQNPGTPIHVYCGTTQCVHAITKLKNDNITVEFLVISDAVEGTPLEYWVARHPINKVLAGKEFETHLADVVTLGLLWNYGGIYVAPTVRIASLVCLHDKNAWVSKGVNVVGIPRVLDVSYFPQYHPFIKKLAELYVSEYPIKGTKNDSFPFNFQRTVWNIFNDSCMDCPNIAADVQLDTVNLTSNAVETRHFGTISYDQRVRDVGVANLGDEIQGFPGLQYLPFLDTFLERDNLNDSQSSSKIIAFFNAWWGSWKATWPPPSNVDPIMLSIHIGVGMHKHWAGHIEYLKQRAPIGCRDYGTLKFLRHLGVNAYFSGCLTLLLENPNISGKRTDNIYIVDVKDSLVKLLPIDVQVKAIRVAHNIGRNVDSLARFTEAYRLMELYASAKLVITQRIHCALPCVAMGTPVIFINSPKMPGGGGSSGKSSPRTVGLTPLFHTLDLYAKTVERAKEWLQSFPWHNVPPNPNISMLMRLRATAWNVIRQNQALYDAAKKFGLVPMTPPIQTQNVSKLVFHLIFTTSNNSILKVSGGRTQTGFFNWRHWRSIESIFYHHPTSRVIIHSNTLSQREFDVLTEAGYSIIVQKYNLEELLEDSPAQNFIPKLKMDGWKGKYWYSHETDLLRILILYRFGGVYMDTDMIIVRPLDSLKMNVIGWEDKNYLNGALMIFEKGNMYLKACLEEFARFYDPHSWGGNGPGLLTRVWKRNRERNDVQVMQYQAFQMIYGSLVKKQCFDETSGEKFDSNMRILRTKAYAVHLNSRITGEEGIYNKLKEGTICSHLLNAYCVLCNEMY